MSSPGRHDEATVPAGSLLRRVQRVRHELQCRHCTVRSVQPVGPGFVPSFCDHVKVFLPEPAGKPAGERPTMRDFTPRAFDTEAGARPGDSLDIGGPRGSMVIPVDFDWHLFGRR